MTDIKVLDRDDLLRVEVMALFKQYGYDRYRTAKFESYEVYRRNKDYIGDESIVTFTSATGKLMALRPDVTLGLLNNLTSVGRKKLCYDENVFRRDEKGEYLELRQMGVENIGASDSYAEYKTVALAVKAMELIGEEYILTIGHMDLVEAFIVEADTDENQTKKALEFIQAKAFHELRKLLGEKGEKLIELVSTEGKWESALKKAEELGSGKADKAIAELKALLSALKKSGLDERVRLDFSLISDYRYYNGIVFRGFVRPIAYAVLSGGRYDNMMRRLGKGDSATGFALDFGGLAGLVKREKSCDTLVIYGNEQPEKVATLVDALVKEGKRVVALPIDDGTVSASEKIMLSEVENA